MKWDQLFGELAVFGMLALIAWREGPITLAGLGALAVCWIFASIASHYTIRWIARRIEAAQKRREWRENMEALHPDFWN